VRSVDALVFIVAGIAVLIAVAFSGIVLAPAPMLPSTGPAHDGALCEVEPLSPVAEMVIAGLTQLCVSEHGTRAWVELVGLRRDALYTGWLAYGGRSLSPQEFRCGGFSENVSETRSAPLRIDRAITDEAGRARFMASYPAIRLSDKEDVWMLVVDHGVLPSGDQSTAVWEPGWRSTASVMAPGSSIAGRLIGCAHFQRRGGVESLE